MREIDKTIKTLIDDLENISNEIEDGKIKLNKTTKHAISKSLMRLYAMMINTRLSE